ncbi:sulfotransferase [uncultured Abyssibacter sp.]|uniref:sulfotransferase family protein n=1 Tax=uncultured Abyssibacter sp. TaxID=2320202 RepID=UPI0032B18760
MNDIHTPQRTARSKPSEAAVGSFAVPTWMHWMSGWQHNHPESAIGLGNFDTRMAEDAIASVEIKAPIYIAGLARSGTTILLELLAEHADVGTHQYRDFPPVMTPWLWDRWLSRVPEPKEDAKERAHGDGISVTSRSPEAFEEVLWMAFFPETHNPAHSNVLNDSTRHPPFEAFYREHIRKLLAIRGAARYVAKGNYNLMRLEYILKLFPDARFLLPIRDPVWHIASLMKQQTLFEAGEQAHPRSLDHMRRVGHFEFGLDRRPMHTGDDDAILEVQDLWARGREVEGWAKYWAMVYSTVADQLDANPALRDACQVIRYEALCKDSEPVLESAYTHCGLDIDHPVIEAAAARLKLPGYYQPAFEASELDLISRITWPTAARFGYAE